MHQLVTALCGLLAAAPAGATVPDAIGMGARWAGAGGGGVAVVDDGTSAFVNPAGLSFVRRPTASIGYLGAWPRFEPVPDLWWDTNRDGVVNELDPALEYDVNPPSMAGFTVQASRNIGGKFGLGLSAYVPTRSLFSFSTFEPSLPNYIMWDNRTQRFVAAAGIGGQILPGLSLGVSANVLARARASVAMTISAGISSPSDTATDLGETVDQVTVDLHEVDTAVVPAVGPIFGMQFDFGQLVPPLRGLVLGASWQEQVSLVVDAQVDTQANVEVSEIGDLDPIITSFIVDAGLQMFDHFVPRKVGLGAAYRRQDALTLYVDARWTDWRAMALNVPTVEGVEVVTPLVDLDPEVIDGNTYRFTMKSVWSVRTGTDLQLPEFRIDGKLRYVRLSFRGGFGLEPSPLVSQGGNSILLDSGRTLYTLGIGVETWDPFELIDGAVTLDGFFQYQTLAAYPFPHGSDEPRAGFPVRGSSIPVGGDLIAAGVAWTFEY